MTTMIAGTKERRAVQALALICAAIVALCPATAQGKGGSGKAAAAPGKAAAEKPSGKGAARTDRFAPLPADVVAREGLSAVLGRPADRSIAVNLLGDAEREVYIERGTAEGAFDGATAVSRLLPGRPLELLLEGLEPDREYFYRVRSRVPGESSYAIGPEGRFHTQRAPGSRFSFEIIGDSHPERPQQFDPTLYAQNLSNSAAASPDFFMTIGDDFSVDTLPAVTEEAVDEIYRRQRLYLSLVGSVAPIFLVNGNHEQASLANLDGTPDNVAVWAQTRRNAFFPQPGPDGFYTGDEEEVPGIGLLRDYYAWTWGDALFVVIDPYWHSPEAVDNAFGGREKTRDLWQVTLGGAQYDWFKKTLEGSRATFKFVFAHHVSGTGRGGVERAPYYEWGGESPDGKTSFATARPGWDAPIHQLMAKNKVTAFVQGHDHIFANQTLDGVAYITLPEPADPNYALYNKDAFESGDTLPNSGRVRFTVDAERVVVEYLREWLPGDEPASGGAGAAAYRFEIPAGGLPDPAAKKQGGARAAPGSGNKRATGAASPTAPPAPADSLHAKTLVEYPGASSVSLATAFLEDVDYYYQYGRVPGELDRSTPKRSAAAGTVARDRIGELEPGRRYAFRLAYAARGSTAFVYSEPGVFATEKEPGQGYTFIVEADPHFDENSSGDVYRASLRRMADDSPDFIIDLGDTSMVEKLAKDEEGYADRDRLVRSYWDDIGSKAPFFMVLGNHDGERGRSAAAGRVPSDAAAALRETWLLDQRTASPATYDVFGDMAYAFEWGDALFVVLDPYANTAAKSSGDGWSWTLGKGQYDWLDGLLSRTGAAYRFVFIHNMLGGKGKDARGGAEFADYYEWGGANADGSGGFADERPGWEKPVGDLFAERGVDVVFRGHDHFYAKEEKDGIVYQLVPQPSLAKAQRLDAQGLADYGYYRGTFLPSPGYLRVSVSPERARVELVRTQDGAVADAYEISP